MDWKYFISVIVGSATTFVGVLFAQKLSSKSKYNNLIRIKSEDIYQLVIKMQSWISQQASVISEKQNKITIENPIEQIYMIGELYLHDLKQQIAVLSHANQSFIECCIEYQSYNNQNRDIPKAVVEGIHISHTNLHDECNKLLELIKIEFNNYRF